MKKFTLALITLAAGTLTHAQINKGSILLGGSLSASTSKAENSNNSNSSIYFSPSVGLAVQTNKVVGVSLWYGNTWYDNSVPVAVDQDFYGGGVFYRQYLPLSKSFYLFGNGTAGYTHAKSESNNASDRTELIQNSVSVSVAPGITYAVSKRFHLEAGMNNLFNIGYGSTKQVYDPMVGATSTSKSSTFNLNLNANPVSDLQVGFRLVLGK